VNAEDPKERWQITFPKERARVMEPGWVKNVNHQQRLIEFIAEWRSQPIIPTDLAELERLAAERLRISPDRFRSIEKIESARDLRRALRAVHHQEKSPRLPGEDIYPDTGWLGAYLEFSQDSEVPLGWHFWCGVAVLGAACRGNLYVDRNTFYITPNLYMIMVGPTAAHKSTAIGHALSVLRVCNELLEEDIEKTTLDRRIVVLPIKLTPEAMVDALVPERKTLKDGSIRQRLQSVGLLHCSELSVLLGKNVMGADRLIHLATDLYGYEGNYNFRTRKDGEKILAEPVLNCLFGSTVEWINKSVTSDLFTGGYVGRNMWLSRDTSKREFPLPYPLDPVIKQELGEMLVPWALTSSTEVEPTEKAEKWFGQWYRHNKKRPPLIPLMEGWKERKQGHLFKLAMILAISDKCGHGIDQLELDRAPNLILELEYLERAAEIIDLEEARMPECFARIGQHADIEVQEEVKATLKYLLGVSSTGWVSHSDLFKRVRHRVGNTDSYRKITRTLLDTGDIEKMTEGKGTYYRMPRSE
jgi:hypothetical protein